MVNKRLVLRLITGVRCQIIICNRYILPGPMEGSPRSLQTDKWPSGSMERKRGLNPSPLQTQLGTNFALFQTLILGFRYLFYGIQAGNVPFGKNLTAGTTILSRAAYLPSASRSYILKKNKKKIKLFSKICIEHRAFLRRRNVLPPPPPPLASRNTTAATER
jgi:hypothetical protein